MPFFGQEIFEQAQKKGPLTEPAYRTAREQSRRLAGKDGLLAALDGNRLDAVIAPASRRRGRPTTCWAITSSAPATAWPPWPAHRA